MKEVYNTNHHSRLCYIDFLKVIGLTGIIIAHVDCPTWAKMLRSFDVPLMVIISSILAKKSYSKYDSSPYKYVLHRIKRLVIPTWIFLTIYFLLFAFYTKEFFSFKFYIDSYFLTRFGIGYVWVILIFLYSSIIIPYFDKFNTQNRICMYVCVYFLYEVAYFFKIGIANKLIYTTFYYFIPYGLLTYFGFIYSNTKHKQRLIIIMTSLLVFVLFGIYYWIVTGSPKIVDIAKYPPRLYYLSYGIMWSFLLLYICEKNNFKIYSNALIQYISMHSMWIYLWHILALSIYKVLPLPEMWILKLFIVYLFSLLAVFVVNLVLDILERKIKLGFLKYFRG